MEGKNAQQFADLLRLEGLKKPDLKVRGIFDPRRPALRGGESDSSGKMVKIEQKLEDNEDVMVREIDDLAVAIHWEIINMEVDYFGDRVTYPRFAIIADKALNELICTQVESTEGNGMVPPIDRLEYLPARTAAILANWPGSLYFRNLIELSPAAARELAKHEGELTFVTLAGLSEEAAKELAEFKGDLAVPDYFKKRIEKYKTPRDE